MSASALKAAATGTYREGNDVFQQLLARPLASSFDPDAYHVMQERDNALIRDELMHGTASKAFVYQFKISGSTVSGISVVGARELASQYKGIKSRIVATVEKRGALFIFRSFNPLNIETRVLHELETDDDFYECVMEVSDIKTGNSIEVRKKESKMEKRSNGSGFYERPHYDVIAESKAYRNGVLSVLPQSVIKDFQARCLAAGSVSEEKTIDQLREGALKHAAKHGIALSRNGLADLSYAELQGLGAAAATGNDAFKKSAEALGVLAMSGADRTTGEIPPPAAPRPPAAARGPAANHARAEPPPADDQPPAVDDGPTGRNSAAPAAEPATTKSAGPIFDANAFAEAIEACKTVDALDLKADQIRDIADAETRETLLGIYRRCREDLQKAPAPAAEHSAGAQQPTRRTRGGSGQTSIE